MSCPQFDPGICAHHGFLGLLWRANAQYFVGYWHIRLVCHSHHWRTLQATLFQDVAREHNRATRTPHHDHDIRPPERLFPPAQVGRVPHLLLCGNYDGQHYCGGAWTRLEMLRVNVFVVTRSLHRSRHLDRMLIYIHEILFICTTL